MKESTRWATAFHEAGHAAACWRRGLKIYNATIISAGDFLGKVQHANPLHGIRLDFDDSIRARQRMEAAIVVCLAGPEAQRRHSPWSWRSHHGAADHALAADLALRMNGSKEATNAYLRWLGIVVRDEVALSWPQIERVARALFERHSLTAPEIAAELADSSPPVGATVG